MEWIIGVLIVWVVLKAFSGSGRCDVCNQAIKKTYYTWKIEGKKQKLCPRCNTKMESRVSSQAFRKKFR